MSDKACCQADGPAGAAAEIARVPSCPPEELFQAFADRTRLRILNLLLRKETCVGDVTTILAIPQPRVSQHLACLRKAGFVSVRRVGPWCFYSLAPPRSSIAARMLDCLRECVQDDPILLADQQRAVLLERAGGCCSAEAP
ncbi:MAG: helix-turn-helix transcriptional regulator [Pirellulales bacterium]|nr:helix-turn-helix transcriptional regulator [Pirellulales bacterium]MBX3432253.1 helix-turn-helix transcriptional regulator [Pirellulales bacterium]